MDRPSFRRSINDIEIGRVETLVFWILDRGDRSTIPKRFARTRERSSPEAPPPCRGPVDVPGDTGNIGSGHYIAQLKVSSTNRAVDDDEVLVRTEGEGL